MAIVPSQLLAFVDVCIMVGAIALTSSAAVAQTATPGWSADAHTGCRVWNPHPMTDEAVTWSGECRGGVANGPGVEQWLRFGVPANRIEGRFIAGKPDGSMTVTYPNGDRYDGPLGGQGGTREGPGSVTRTNGERYVGVWHEGELSGPGTHYWPDGRAFRGIYVDGKANGPGCFIWPDGKVFIGQYRDGRPRGQGTMYDADGRIVKRGMWGYDDESGST